MGRWAHEKRIEKIINNVPDHLLCVVVGDGGVESYVQMICDVSKKTHNVLTLRGMVDVPLLRTYYTAADLYVSASNFETCGNTLPESWCCGTPVAVEPSQGHLEWLQDGMNGFAIDVALTHVREGGFVRGDHVLDTVRTNILGRL